MQFPVYDQHRSRLGGEVYLRPSLNERVGFQDASDLSGHVKHTVWSHVEVTGTRARVGTHQLPTLVCTENLKPNVMVMKSTEDRISRDVADPLNGTKGGRIFVQ